MKTYFVAASLFLAACGSSGTATTDNSSKPATSGKPAASATADKGATDSPAAAAPPADPLDDSGTPQASCDNVKADGACTEYFNLGMTEETTKKLCDGDGAKGKWEKGKGCTKDGRVAVCRTSTDRMIYYKSFPFAPGNTLVEVRKLCTDGLEGKFAELPKK